MADAQGGQGGTQGGAGAGGAGAGGGDVGAGGAAGAGAGGAGGASAPWHGLTEAADIAIVETKGWKSPADLYKSYRGAEALIGRDPSTLLTIPRADDAAGLRAVQSRLGMPETHDKYEVEIPQGVDPTYGNWAKETFHKVGLTATQAKDLAKANNEFYAKQAAEQNKAYDLQVQTDKRSLLVKWGGGFERKMSAAQTAAKSLGMSGEMVEAIERHLGYGATMEYMAELGAKMGEAEFHSGTQKPGFGTMTPEEAKIEYEKMILDPAVKSALLDNSHPGHKAAVAKKQQLFGVMHPA